MIVSYLKQLEQELRHRQKASGIAADPQTLPYWSQRASANSYHSKGDGPRTKQLGTRDLNHSGGTYERNVRRGPI